MPADLFPHVAIVLLNYKGVSDTIECLDSLRAITYPNYQIVVVDNASPDGSFQKLQEYPELNHLENKIFHSPADAMENRQSAAGFTLIQSGFNGGYAFGNNIGIKYGLKDGAEYILLLNNDTVVDPNFLEPLVRMCEQNKDIGIVSSKTYYHDRPDVIWFNGGKLHPRTGRVEQVHINEKDVGQSPPEYNTFISGCVMLIPGVVFDKVGLLNEDYFMYVEDLEFSQRVLQVKLCLRVCEASHVWHKVGSATGGMHSGFSVYWRSRNMNRFISLRMRFLTKLPALLIFNARAMCRLILAKRPDLMPGHLAGMIAGIRKKAFNSPLPTFFIVGAPKAGTTSLYHYLKQHQDVFFPDKKEPNYFSGQEILEQGLYYSDKPVSSLEKYESLYRNATGFKVRGDASVSYLFYPSVANKIKKLVPDAKIIIMLRNPVERAYSHYLMDRRLGMVKMSFEDIVLRRSEHKLQDLYYQQYVELGLYADQLERYLKVFGEDKVYIILFEEFKNNPLHIFKGVCSFLEISDEYEPELERYNTFALPGNKVFAWVYHLNWLRKILGMVFPDKEKKFLEDFVLSDKQKPKIPGELTNLLRDIYENDIKRLDNLLGRNLYDYWRIHD